VTGTGRGAEQSLAAAGISTALRTLFDRGTPVPIAGFEAEIFKVGATSFAVMLFSLFGSRPGIRRDDQNFRPGKTS
jgi:hypothetical protein